MAEQPKNHSDDEEQTNLNYVPPAPKSVDEIVSQDQDDESLNKYKKMLLGDGAAGEKVVVFPDDPRHVIVNKLALCVEGRPDLELDLTAKADEIKKHSFTLKEGCQYRIKIYFYVQHEIVTGLRYEQKSFRMGGIQVDKTKLMVGSYPPKKELQNYITPLEDAPSGMVARGSYTIKSLFTDDDKNEHLKWEWKLDIKKDWD